jgi:hypothetical protein
MDEERLRASVESQHGGSARLAQSVPVKETHNGQTVWEGVVHVFDLADHPKATRLCVVVADRGQRQAPVLCRAAMGDQVASGRSEGGDRGRAAGWRRTVRRSLVAMVIFIATPAFGDATSADLYAACVGAPGTKADVICGAYVNGFLDGVLGDQIAKEGGVPICLPSPINSGHVRELIVKSFVAYPSLLSVNSGGAVAAILQRAYPCPKSN